jgi:peroxiredoxin Q/BCP
VHETGVRDPRRLEGVPRDGRGGFWRQPTDAASHAKFKAKYDLPFTLLVDDDHKLADEFGFWKQKTFSGKKYMGIERSTVVIGEDGTVETIWRRVKPDHHAAQLLESPQLACSS